MLGSTEPTMSIVQLTQAAYDLSIYQINYSCAKVGGNTMQVV